MCVYFFLFIFRLSRKIEPWPSSQHTFILLLIYILLSPHAYLTIILLESFVSVNIYSLVPIRRGVLNKSTLVFQLEEVCGIKVVAHKIENVLGGIYVTIVILNDMIQIQVVAHKERPPQN